MTTIASLVDTNVLVAAVTKTHQHNGPSIALFARSPPKTLAVSTHSFAEAYSTLTRQNAISPFKLSANEAWAALESFAAATALVGLSPAQTYDAIRTYAAEGGVGPRLYDRLIGQAALIHGLRRIVTWNVAHMRSLFPGLEVVDPSGG